MIGPRACGCCATGQYENSKITTCVFMAVFETLPPFVIITGAVMLMGGLQGLIHKGFYGKPKPHGTDEFDRSLSLRDALLKQQPDLFQAEGT